MPSLVVARLQLSTVNVVGRTIPVQIGDRQVALRVRRCGENAHADPIRITVFTTTADNLPSKRRMAAGRQVSARRETEGTGGIITAILSAADARSLPSVSLRPSRDDALLWPAIADVMDQILPEYRFE